MMKVYSTFAITKILTQLFTLRFYEHIDLVLHSRNSEENMTMHLITAVPLVSIPWITLFLCRLETSSQENRNHDFEVRYIFLLDVPQEKKKKSLQLTTAFYGSWIDRVFLYSNYCYYRSAQGLQLNDLQSFAKQISITLNQKQRRREELYFIRVRNSAFFYFSLTIHKFLVINNYLIDICKPRICR